jgi:hypothetical protein
MLVIRVTPIFKALSDVAGASIVVIVNPLAPFASMIRALPSSPNMSAVEGTTLRETVSVPLEDCAEADKAQAISNSKKRNAVLNHAPGLPIASFLENDLAHL